MGGGGGGGGKGGDLSSAGEGPQYICIHHRLKLDTGTHVIVYAVCYPSYPLAPHRICLLPGINQR